jgi:threonylcarbamoyladenosine tRNA methylthiotransferase MtaB
LNQCESEAIADAFVHEGFEVVAPNAEADLCIVNTCTVTTKAEQKARRMIRKFIGQSSNPVVLITGCYAQLEREELQSLAERIVVVSLDAKPSLLGLPLYLANHHIGGIDLLDSIEKFAASKKGHLTTSFDYEAATFSFHSRAFLKIQDGCDNSCAYCRVTIARGESRSLSVEQVIERTLTLQQEGFREVVLTGVNISAYRSEGYDLRALLIRLLEELGSDIRIRLSSLEPDRLDEKLVAVFADPRLQPHFHLPVQSGSPVVLQRVNRHYSIERLAQVITMLREVKEDPFIAADIITGLPGETDAEFEKTLTFLKAMDFSQLHVFPFSPRPQTALFHAQDRVPERVRDERAKLLRSLSAIHLRRYMDRQIGKKVEVIIEDKQKGMWSGLTGNYLKIGIADPPAEIKRGALLPVYLVLDPKSGLPIGRCSSV